MPSEVSSKARGIKKSLSPDLAIKKHTIYEVGSFKSESVASTLSQLRPLS